MKKFREKKYLYIIFIRLDKAYDRALWVLERKRVSNRYIDILKRSFKKEAKCLVKMWMDVLELEGFKISRTKIEIIGCNL